MIGLTLLWGHFDLEIINIIDHFSKIAMHSFSVYNDSCIYVYSTIISKH